jgi:hypothetical protein
MKKRKKKRKRKKERKKERKKKEKEKKHLMFFFFFFFASFSSLGDEQWTLADAVPASSAAGKPGTHAQDHQSARDDSPGRGPLSRPHGHCQPPCRHSSPNGWQ